MEACGGNATEFCISCRNLFRASGNGRKMDAEMRGGSACREGWWRLKTSGLGRREGLKMTGAGHSGIKVE